jgi:hypothetical protein
MTCSGWTRGCVALAVALAATLSAASARAEEFSDFGLFGLQAYATAWGKPPSLLIQGNSAPPRIAGMPSPPGALTTVGVGADLTLRMDGLLLQLVQLRYSEALGQPRYGIETADQMPFQVTSGPLHLFELGSPIVGLSGIGGQLVGNRFKMKIFGDGGIAWAWSTATVRDPTSGNIYGSSMTNQSLFVRAEIDACLRTGQSWPSSASSWACLTAATNVYEFDWFSGMSLGVRVDL